MIRGVKIVSIPVSNQDVSLKFYTEKMGFKIATDQPFGEGQRWIELLIPGSDTNIALFTPQGHENRIGGFQPVTFWCDDVFATAKAMQAKGVELTAEPRKERGERWGSSRIRTGTSLCFRAGESVIHHRGRENTEVVDRRAFL